MSPESICTLPKTGDVLENGAKVLLSYTDYTPSEVAVLLCDYRDEFVVWIYNAETGNCLRGKYINNPRAAAQVFVEVTNLYENP